VTNRLDTIPSERVYLVQIERIVSLRHDGDVDYYYGIGVVIKMGRGCCFDCDDDIVVRDDDDLLVAAW